MSPWPGRAPPACLLGRHGIGWARVSPELLERWVDGEGGVEGGRRHGWGRGGRQRGMSPGRMGAAAAAAAFGPKETDRERSRGGLVPLVSFRGTGLSWFWLGFLEP